MGRREHQPAHGRVRASPPSPRPSRPIYLSAHIEQAGHDCNHVGRSGTERRGQQVRCGMRGRWRRRTVGQGRQAGRPQARRTPRLLWLQSLPLPLPLPLPPCVRAKMDALTLSPSFLLALYPSAARAASLLLSSPLSPFLQRAAVVPRCRAGKGARPVVHPQLYRCASRL